MDISVDDTIYSYSVSVHQNNTENPIVIDEIANPEYDPDYTNDDTINELSNQMTVEIQFPGDLYSSIDEAENAYNQLIGENIHSNTIDVNTDVIYQMITNNSRTEKNDPSEYTAQLQYLNLNTNYNAQDIIRLSNTIKQTFTTTNE